MITQLDERHIDQMLDLQRQCMDNSDIFLPTSREGYLRAFQFDNFCYGYMEEGALIAFLNCSIPTSRGKNNLGRGRLPDALLDFVGHMNTLLVRKTCRHHGVGRDLVRTVLDEFMRRGCPHIFVTASPENAASLRLLKIMDFRALDSVRLGNEHRLLLYRDLGK